MSAVHAVSAALVELWTPTAAAVGFELGHGAPLKGYGVTDMVRVQHDGTPDSREEARFRQSWLDLACTRRMEQGEIVCSVISQTGDDDLSIVEARAVAILDALHVALIADRTLGGLVDGVQVESGTVLLLQNAAGVAVVLPFTVGYAVVVPLVPAV